MEEEDSILDKKFFVSYGKHFPRNLAAKFQENKVSDEDIHQYCLYALEQSLQHGNTGFAIRLLEFLGRKYKTKRKIAFWFCKYGNFKINRDGRLVYRKRKDVRSINILDALAKASNIPYYSEQLGEVSLPKLTTTPIVPNKNIFGKEKDGSGFTSIWAVSGGLPTLGKRR